MTAAVRLSIGEAEAQHLLILLDDFRALLDTQGDSTVDPALERLTPAAYRDDDDAAAGFRDATRSHLFDRRTADALHMRRMLAVFEEAEDPALLHRDVFFTPEDVDPWLRTLTAIRLVVASRLGIDSADVQPSDDAASTVYDWLGYRLEQLVRLADAFDGL